MNYYLRLLFSALIFLLLIKDTTLIVVAEQTPDPVLISNYEDDLTGDGQKETIKLKGVLFSEEGNYYRDVWTEITSKHSEQWRIQFEGGYEPEIQFFDLNHDNINDLFYRSATGGSGGLYSHHLYTLKNNTIKEIPLPQQSYIKGNFKDDFQINIQISIKNNSRPIILNVENRAKEYMRLGLYNKQGKLMKPITVMIPPIAFYEPILISKSTGYGLKSYQQISGAYHADQLGTIETLWYLENNQWVILQTNWVAAD